MCSWFNTPYNTVNSHSKLALGRECIHLEVLSSRLQYESLLSNNRFRWRSLFCDVVGVVTTHSCSTCRVGTGGPLLHILFQHTTSLRFHRRLLPARTAISPALTLGVGILSDSATACPAGGAAQITQGSACIASCDSTCPERRLAFSTICSHMATSDLYKSRCSICFLVLESDYGPPRGVRNGRWHRRRLLTRVSSVFLQALPGQCDRNCETRIKKEGIVPAVSSE